MKTHPKSAFFAGGDKGALAALGAHMQLVSTKWRPWGLIYALGPTLGRSGVLGGGFQKSAKKSPRAPKKVPTYLRCFFFFFFARPLVCVVCVVWAVGSKQRKQRKQRSRITSVEHPGAYVVRIRGGPKTDRRGWGFGFELDGHGICNGICIWGGAGGGWRYLQKKRAYQRRWYRIAY